LTPGRRGEDRLMRTWGVATVGLGALSAGVLLLSGWPETIFLVVVVAMMVGLGEFLERSGSSSPEAESPGEFALFPFALAVGVATLVGESGEDAYLVALFACAFAFSAIRAVGWLAGALPGPEYDTVDPGSRCARA